MMARDTSTHGDRCSDNSLFRAAMDVLDRANIGVILTDGQATVKIINNAALALTSGPLLLLRGNRLDCTSKRTTGQLHRVIREVAGGPRTSDNSAVEKTELEWVRSDLVIAGIASPAGRTLRRFALLLTSCAARGVRDHPAEHVQLTPAETRLLRALVGGQQLRSYAAEAGISLTTVKTHLRGLFDKTGERRQSALILRALSDPMLVSQWTR